MEESATTAIYTGAFLMVFISSLTIALFLFNNVVNLAETAYNFYVNLSNEQTIVNVPVGQNLLLSAEEVASYYYNYVQKDIYSESEDANKDYVVTIKDKDGNALSGDLKYKEIMEKLGSTNSYILSYDSVDKKGKVNITIKKATDAQINATY
jgi:lipopolysaccharide export LptBFGC system permease protein LptF